MISEQFLGFTDVTDQSAEGLVKNIISSLEKLNLDMIRCRGQGYDGASVMSGVYTGVLNRIMNIEPLCCS